MVHVWSVDLAHVGERVDPGECGSALCWRTRKSVGDPSQGNDVARVVGSNHETHGEVARSEFDGACSDDEGHNSEDRWQRNVKIALPRAVCMPSIGEDGNDSDYLFTIRCRQIVVVGCPDSRMVGQ